MAIKWRSRGLLALGLVLAAHSAAAQNYNVQVRLTPPTLTNNTNSPSLWESPNGGGLYVSLLDPTSGAFLGTSGNPLVTTASGGSSTVNQGTQAVSATGSTWFFQQYLGGSAVSASNPVPTYSSPLSYASPGANVSVLTSSTQITNAAAYTHTLTLCTTIATTGNVWLNLNGGAAVLSTGVYIPANGGCLTMPAPTAAVFGISDSGTAIVTVQGG